jgi:hypothetical protein
MAEPEDRSITRQEMAALGIILVAHLAALVFLAWRTGVTIDEPAHMLSASLYWRGADNLQPRDMPPLIKIVGGWVPALLGLPVPYDNRELMAAGHEWPIALEMMARMKGDEIVRKFFLSRLPLLVFPLGCMVLVWRWSRQLFSRWIGVALASLFALEPTALGHGALFKNDLAATFAFLLLWYRLWRFWRVPIWKNAAWLGFAVLLCVLAKMSLLVFVPIAVLVAMIRQRNDVPGLLRTMPLVVLIPYAGSLAAWQFDAARLRGADFQAYKASGDLPRWPLYPAKVFSVLPIPKGLWEGATNLMRSDEDPPAVYLLGESRQGGDRLYFAAALGVKVPAALQILVFSGLAGLLVGLWRRRWQWEDLLWATPPVVYIVLASLSSLQLGVRLVLPALPFGLLWAGAGLVSLANQRLALGAAFAATLLVLIPVVRVFPHCLSFFNVWVGGAANGIHYLSDSNLDWGQDLRELERYRRNAGIERITLSYFGMDNPYAHLGENVDLVAPPWTPEHARGRWLVPTPGVWAVSATLLTGQFFRPEFRDYYRAFRSAPPIARAGYSIFIFSFTNN